MPQNSLGNLHLPVAPALVPQAAARHRPLCHHLRCAPERAAAVPVRMALRYLRTHWAQILILLTREQSSPAGTGSALWWRNTRSAAAAPAQRQLQLAAGSRWAAGGLSRSEAQKGCALTLNKSSTHFISKKKARFYEWRKALFTTEIRNEFS